MTHVDLYSTATPRRHVLEAINANMPIAGVELDRAVLKKLDVTVLCGILLKLIGQLPILLLPDDLTLRLVQACRMTADGVRVPDGIYSHLFALSASGWDRTLESAALLKSDLDQLSNKEYTLLRILIGHLQRSDRIRGGGLVTC